jgi:hypothetical protein
MYQPYIDILDRLGNPLWWDEHGVPRYEAFTPRLCSDIYADFAALLEIQCQECDRTFPVASSWNLVENALDRSEKNPPQDCKLPHDGDAGDFTYGDAPWHDSNPEGKGQCGGTTMTTFVVRILQFYKRDVGDWIRLPEHEVYVGEQDQP